MAPILAPCESFSPPSEPFLTANPHYKVTTSADMAADKRTREQLTPKERQVARWLAQAKTNWEIGTILGISTRTVEKHVENLLRKLHVENRTAAALEISRDLPMGLTDLD